MDNQDFDFGEQGKMQIFFRRTREQVPLLPWEGLNNQIPLLMEMDVSKEFR